MIPSSIPMYPANSSQISYIGYDKENKTLYVKFTNASVFKYFDVDENIFKTLLNSPSKGKYFNSIKNNYKYEKI